MSTSKKDKVLRTRKTKTHILPLTIAAVALAGAAALFLIGPGKRDPGFLSQSGYEQKDGFLYIPLSDFSDSDARFYQYSDRQDPGATNINFFVLESSDGVMRAAFDACDVCFQAQKGYSQDGDVMVCNNCGQRFASVRINEEKGGCNPSPLKRQVVGDYVVIAETDLLAGAFYF